MNFARFRAWSRPCARCAALFFSFEDARLEASIFASSLARSPFFFSFAAPLIRFFSARTVSSSQTHMFARHVSLFLRTAHCVAHALASALPSAAILMLFR